MSDREPVHETEQLRAFFTAALDGFVVLDDQMRYVEANPAACAMLGYTRDELLHIDVGAVTPAAHRALLSANWAGFLRTGSLSGTWPCVRKDGTLLTVEYRAVANAVPDGRHLAVMHDVSERERVAAELLRTHGLLQGLLDSSSDAIFVKDLAGRYVLMNPAAGCHMNRPVAEMLGKSAAELAPPEFVAATNESDRKVLEQGGVLTYEIVDPLGRTMLMSKGVLRDASGAPTGVFGVARDITERKQAEQALRDSEERYRSVVAALQEGILLLDVAGAIQACNQSAARILGSEAQTLAGRRLGDPAWHWLTEDGSALAPAAHPAQVTLETAVASGSAVIGIRRQELPPVWLSVNAQPLLRDGVLQGVVVSLHDISERRLAESALQQLSGQLLRTQDEERQRIARDLHDSTGQALAALHMNLVLLARRIDSPPPLVRALLSESRGLVEQASREIRTVGYLLHPPLLDEVGLASAVQWFAQGFADRSGVAVDVDVPVELERPSREIETAAFRIVQESLNNVRRHAGATRAAIRLVQDAGLLVVEVRDQGCGMTREALERARSGAAGMGIGIAGMRERLRQVGGRFEIDSGPQGTLVRATLPCTPATPTPATPQPAPFPAER